MCSNTSYFNYIGFILHEGLGVLLMLTVSIGWPWNLLSSCLSTPDCWVNSPVLRGLV